MSKTDRNSLQVVAMHGWAGDSRCWEPWIAATTESGWHWQCGERGYGELEPRHAVWPTDSPGDALRVVIGHSLGPHLVAPDTLQRADAVVFLASFGAFVPPGRAGRHVRAALDGMAAKLASESEAKEMLRKFLANAAHPQPAALLPIGPENGPLRLEALRADLDILRACDGLPRGFPNDARVLVIEAEDDRIVTSEARALLRKELPNADIICLPGAGHALLQTDVLAKVVKWAGLLR